MKSPVITRTRPTFWDGLVVLLILCGAGLLLFLFRPTDGGVLTAKIVMADTAPTIHLLSSAVEATTFSLPGAAYPITVEIDHGRIRIAHSDCPSQDCVRTGWVSRAGGQIVCLPNQLVISITGTLTPAVEGVVR